ncbi:MAG: hypothetical protein JSV66_11240 [Trueperaceae bacterium]|nr:MAG: hypothetical protein JSV66_11240 [Trueperaceae bacterium]
MIVAFSRVLFATFLTLWVIAFANPFVWPDSWTAHPEEATPGGVFYTWDRGNPRTFNPFVSKEANVVMDLSDNGARLLRKGPNSSRWLPYAAEKYSVSDDGRTIEMILRRDLRWSDGTPITSRDYLFRYQAITDPTVGTDALESWFVAGEPIQLEAPDPYTLRFALPMPDRLAFEVIAGLLPAPSHLLEQPYLEGGAEALLSMWDTSIDPNATVWSGPFVPVQYLANERIVFARNPWFGVWNVDPRGISLPYLDSISVALLSSEASALTLFVAGDLDFYVPRDLDEIAFIRAEVDRRPDIDLVENAGLPIGSNQIFFNWNKASEPFKQALFRSVLFRRAMSHLTDRQAIIELVYGGAGVAQWTSVYPAYEEWLNPGTPRYPYDPEKAAELLEKLGFRQKNADGILVDDEGKALSFFLGTNAASDKNLQIAQLFADAAREIGVEVIPQPLEVNSMISRLLTEGMDRPFDAILVGTFGAASTWPFDVNATTCNGFLHIYNRSGDCLDPVEAQIAALQRQGRLTLDDAHAREIAAEIQMHEAEAQLVLYMPTPRLAFAWNTRIGGYHPNDLMNVALGPGQIELTFVREKF